jgi:toxin YoeB
MTAKIAWEPDAWQEYLHWQQTDRKVLARINALIRDILRHPFEGIGKPEPLRHQLKGQWARRITQEHRLVYKVEGEGDGLVVTVLQCRFHY